MTFIFRNRTIFWDILKWNKGQTKWDGGSKTVNHVSIFHPSLNGRDHFNTIAKG